MSSIIILNYINNNNVTELDAIKIFFWLLRYIALCLYYYSTRIKNITMERKTKYHKICLPHTVQLTMSNIGTKHIENRRGAEVQRLFVNTAVSEFDPQSEGMDYLIYIFTISISL